MCTCAYIRYTEARTYSLPSLRVFAPRRAFRAGVDRLRRYFLGRWAAEQSADVYIRQHSLTVEAIWNEFMAKTKMEGGGWDPPPSELVSTEITGEAYFPPAPTFEGGVFFFWNPHTPPQTLRT